jgi:AraC-like DNA-binding protein
MITDMDTIRKMARRRIPHEFRLMRSPVFRRILVANLLLLLLLASVVGGNFWYSSHVAVEESKRMGSQQLRKLSEVIDGEINAVNSMLFALSRNATVSNLGALREYLPIPVNTRTVASLRELLRMARRSREYYAEVFVHFPKIGLYVSTDGSSNERVFDARILQSPTAAHMLMSRGDTPLVIIRQVTVAPVGATYATSGRDMMMHEYRTLNANIAIVIDSGELSKLVDRSLSTKNETLAGYLPGTNVAYTFAGERPSVHEFQRSVSDGTNDVSPKSMLRFNSTSESSGLQYELFISRSILASRLFTLRIVAMALLLGLIFLDFLIFLMLKARIYQPLHDLISSVSGNDSEIGNNEYELLTDAFERMQSRLAAAETRLLQQEQEAKNLIPKKVMSRLGKTDVEHELELHEFVVATVVVEGVVNTRDEARLDRLIVNAIRLLGAVEVFGQSTPRSIYVPVPESEDIIDALRRVIEPFQAGDVLLLAGISEVFKTLDDAGAAFKQSVRALDMHCFGSVDTGMQIAVFDRVRADRFKVQLLVPEYEHKFVVALTIGDDKTATEQIDTVFARMSKLSRREIAENARYLADLIYSVALKQNAGTPEFDVSYFEMFESVYRPINFQTPLIDSARRICTVEKNRHEDVTALALEVLHRNYTNPQFSIDSLASEIRMSSAYVSRLISNGTGRTFTEHLTHLRMTAAIQMLGETTLFVKEIAQRSGFPSVDTFIRSFKRQHGTTPEQYRRHVPRPSDNQ